MKLEKVITADGTATFKRLDLDETYHSIHGAVQESMHVFIKEGLHTIKKDRFKILEVGLGTGLNALLTAIYVGQNRFVEYAALEPYPLKYENVCELGFQHLHESAGDILKNIFSTQHYQKTTLSDKMIFELLQEKLHYVRLMQKFDLIYYDAFGPRTQPEMWNEEAVASITHHAKPETVLVTYCSQGQFRRNLEAAGWKVEKLEGPPGKREIVRAIKD